MPPGAVIEETLAIRPAAAPSSRASTALHRPRSRTLTAKLALLDGQLVERLLLDAREDRGVVDERVDPPETFERRIGERLGHHRRRPWAPRARRAHGLCPARWARRREVAARPTSPSSCEGERIRAAEALRGACDDRYAQASTRLSSTASGAPSRSTTRSGASGATSGRGKLRAARKALGSLPRSGSRPGRGSRSSPAGGVDSSAGDRQLVGALSGRLGIETSRDRALPADPDPGLAPEGSLSQRARRRRDGDRARPRRARGLVGSPTAGAGCSPRGATSGRNGAGGSRTLARSFPGRAVDRDDRHGHRARWRGPVAVRMRALVAAFHDWSCAAVAVRRPRAARRCRRDLGMGRPLPSAPGRGSMCRSGVERQLGRLQLRSPHTTAGAPRLMAPPSSRVASSGSARADDRPAGGGGARHGARGRPLWLGTSDGRRRAAHASLDALEARLAPAGFLRVSRTTMVNLHRVREIAPAFKGGVWVVTDCGASVAVSRRRVAALRAALGL